MGLAPEDVRPGNSSMPKTPAPPPRTQPQRRRKTHRFSRQICSRALTSSLVGLGQAVKGAESSPNKNSLRTSPVGNCEDKESYSSQCHAVQESVSPRTKRQYEKGVWGMGPEACMVWNQARGEKRWTREEQQKGGGGREGRDSAVYISKQRAGSYTNWGRGGIKRGKGGIKNLAEEADAGHGRVVLETEARVAFWDQRTPALVLWST
eukprot:2646655-Rhodomonas_salina.3